jgi:adhesin/invasin
MTPGRKTSRRQQGWQAWGKRVALTQIAAQIGMIVAPLYTTHAHAQGAEAQEQEQAEPEQNAPQDAKLQKLAEIVKQVGEASNVPNSSVDLKAMAGQQLSSGAASAAEDYLNRFGTARVDLGAMHDMRNFSGAVDTLIPLADTESNLVFTQLGLRRHDGQITGNLGVGHRHFTDNWMLGVNAFYDQNISRGHQRAGVGVEAWRDYLKLSGNAYLRISDWKASPDLLDYDERPANGFDLRAEGYLPAMPSLGAKLMYEQYFGNEVGLFGVNNRQSNPSAVTVGLNYTPIPLMTVGVDHRRGNGGNSTSANVQFTYKLGEPWAKQIDPRQVAARRSLAGSRTDLVERNNNIVLEYRKRQLIKLHLPAQVAGKSANTVDLQYTIESTYGLGRIQWQDGALAAAGGAIIDAGAGVYQVRLPLYQAGTANTYPLTAVAYDVQGNASAMAATTVVVAPGDVDAAKTQVSASPLVIPANGKGASVVTIKLVDDHDNAIGGMASAMNATLDETLDTAAAAAMATNLPAQPATLGPITETQPGIYQLTLTAGTRPSTIVVTPSVHDTALSDVSIAAVPDAASARIDAGNFIVITDGVVANGTATNQVRAKVTDEAGSAVPNVAVSFQLSGSAQVAAGGSPTQNTDDKGYVTLLLTNVKAETVTVGATLDNGAQASVDTAFVADPDTAGLQGSDLGVDKTVVVSNGTDRARFTAIVKDANQNVVPGVTVAWGSSAGNLSAPTSVTDDNGVATVDLTHTLAATVQVNAQVGASGTVNAPDVTFVADSDNAQIGNGDVKVDKTVIIANDTDIATYTATVKDANGNVVPNVAVNWATDLGTLSGASSTTDANGVATIPLRGTQAGAAHVNAQVGTSGAVTAPDVTFVADSDNAQIGNGDVKVDKTVIIANDTDIATYTATVKDGNGNVVPNVAVSWATDLGTLSGASSTTDANGVATITLRGTQAGAAHVNAQVGASGAVTAPEVAFVADSDSAQIGNGDIKVDKRTLIANDTDIATYTAIVKDGNGNVVPNVLVGWATDLGTLSGAASTTDADGVATITLRGTQAGNARVNAQVGTSGAVNAPVVTFAADSHSAQVSKLYRDNPAVIANDTDVATYTAIVKDGNGNLVPNVEVNWATDLGTLSGATSTTDAKGIATITLQSTQTGKAHVNAQAGTSGAVNAPVVTFVADSHSAQISNGDVTVNKTSIVADDAEEATFSAIVKDANGNPVSGVDVTWSTDLGTLSGATSQTSAKGVATITLRGTLVGTAHVSAQVGTSGAVNAPDVTFTADSNSAQIGSGDLTVDTTSVVANGTALATFKAIVKDGNGNLVPNVTVTWATDLGTLSGTSSKTDANGVATITLQSTQAGNAQVNAQVGTAAAVNAPVVTFTADPLSAGIGSGDVGRDKDFIVANNVEAATFTALVKDANGNPVPNVEVKWATDHGTLSGTTSKTNAAGEATIELRASKLGSAQVNASVGSGTPVNAQPVKLIADYLSAEVKTVTSSLSKITGTGAESTKLTATVKDANGHPVQDMTVIWSTTLGDVADPVSITDINGEVSTSLTALSTATTNQDARITAKAGVSTSDKDTTVTVRSVMQVGGRYFWTQRSEFPAATAAEANAQCSAHGGGAAAKLADVSAFAAAGGDFKRMSVANEFQSNIWFEAADNWGNNGYSFSSDLPPVGGAYGRPVSGQYYVCTK